MPSIVQLVVKPSRFLRSLPIISQRDALLLRRVFALGHLLVFHQKGVAVLDLEKFLLLLVPLAAGADGENADAQVPVDAANPRLLARAEQEISEPALHRFHGPITASACRHGPWDSPRRDSCIPVG